MPNLSARTGGTSALRRYAALALCLALVLSSMASSAMQDKQNPDNGPSGKALPQVRGIHWGSTLAMDGSGLYNEIIDYLRSRGPAFDYQPAPYKRTLRAISRGTVDCIFPFDIDTLSHGYDVSRDEIWQTMPIFRATAHMVSDDPDDIPHSLADVGEKRVIQQLGEDYHTVDHLEDLNFFTVADEDVALKALLGGRADYLLGSAPDFLILADKHKAKLFYDPDWVVFAYDIRIMCRQSTITRDFIKSLDRVIASEDFRTFLAGILRQRKLPEETVTSFLPKTLLGDGRD